MSKPSRGGLRLALVLLTLVVPSGVLAVAAPAEAAGTVTVAVTGQGSATGDGIDCNQSGGPDCSQFYADSSHQECDPTAKPPCTTVVDHPFVTMTAGPDSNGYVFDGWSGCDSVSGRACSLEVTSDAVLIAGFRDAQAPTVPAPPGGVRRGTTTLSAAPTDNSGTINRVEFRVRGVLVATDTTAPYGASFNTASIADGTATLRVTAFDASGNSSFAESTMVIDNTAPSLSVTGPDGQTVRGGTAQTWALDAADATSGISGLQCSVVPEGSPASYAPCSSSTAHTVTGLAGGSYTFTAEATDGAGNLVAVERSFVVDALKPTIASARPSPGSATRDRTPLISAVVQDRRTATLTGSVPRSGIKLLVDGVSRPFTYGATTGRVSWQSFTQPTGKHTVQLVATDAVGNRASRTWSFRIRR